MIRTKVVGQVVEFSELELVVGPCKELLELFVPVFLLDRPSHLDSSLRIKL